MGVCFALLTEASGGISKREVTISEAQKESKADGDAYMNYYDDNYYWDSNYQDYSFVPNSQGPQIHGDYPDYSPVPNSQGTQIYSEFSYQDYPAVPYNSGPHDYLDLDYPDYSSVPNNPGPQISLEDYSYVSTNQGPSIPSDSDYSNPVSLPVNQNTPTGPDNLANDQRPKVKSFVYFGSPAQKEKWVTNQAPVRSFTNFQAQKEKTKVKVTNQAPVRSLTNFQVQKEKTKIKVTNQAKPKSQQDTNIGTALKTIGRNIGKTIKNILNPSRKN